MSALRGTATNACAKMHLEFSVALVIQSNMVDVRAKFAAPSIAETAFNCTHCGALAKQSWFSIHADALGRDRVPPIWTVELVETFDFAKVPEGDRATLKETLMKMAKGPPFIKRENSGPEYSILNLSVAQCYNCSELSIWIYDRLVYPEQGEAPLPNSDLSEDVVRDYLEASSILDRSPRGAAALLRLCVQKICRELGGNGRDINADIGQLVANGLDKRVQQALDVVRVVGNNAVHPGQIDLRDNRITAEKLFNLVNIIADIMISQPKHLQSMFDDLPDGYRAAIAKRDAKSDSDLS